MSKFRAICGTVGVLGLFGLLGLGGFGAHAAAVQQHATTVSARMATPACVLCITNETGA